MYLEKHILPSNVRKGFIKNLQCWDSFRNMKTYPTYIFSRKLLETLFNLPATCPASLQTRVTSKHLIKNVKHSSRKRLTHGQSKSSQSVLETTHGGNTLTQNTWQRGACSNVPLALFAQGGVLSLLNDLYCPRLLSERPLKFPSPWPGKYWHIL